jgi:hypothetical protein
MLIAGRATAQDLSPIHGAARVVSKVSYVSWDQAKGWVELEDRQTIIEVYGADRRIQCRELSYGENTPLEKTIFIYSSEAVQKITLDPNEKLLRKAEVTSVDGRTIEKVYTAGGALLFYNVLRMDPAGRTIEVERWDAQEVLVYRIRYLYDAKGNMTEAACLNPDGSTAFVSSFTYSGFNIRGAWLTRRESCSFADVRMRPKEIIRRSISAGGAN